MGARQRIQDAHPSRCRRSGVRSSCLARQANLAIPSAWLGPVLIGMGLYGEWSSTWSGSPRAILRRGRRSRPRQTPRTPQHRSRMPDDRPGRKLLTSLRVVPATRLHSLAGVAFGLLGSSDQHFLAAAVSPSRKATRQADRSAWHQPVDDLPSRSAQPGIPHDDVRRRGVVTGPSSRATMGDASPLAAVEWQAMIDLPPREA